MRKELNSLDIHYLVEEFQRILNGKIDKIWQQENDFVFHIHHSEKGKIFLRFLLPGLIYLSSEKHTEGESGKFGLSIRKHISNARIRKISQTGFERITIFWLDVKGKMLKLVFELFRPGNIILCDDKDKIIMAFSYKGFGSRLIRPGIVYTHPKREINPAKMTEIDFEKVLESSDKSSIVITLAVNFGLGGLYGEEACLKAEIDKNKQSLNQKEKKRLFQAIKKLCNEKIEAHAYFDNGEITEITPLKMELFRNKRYEIFQSISEAMDKFITKAYHRQNAKFSKIEKEKKMIESIISSQEQQILGFLKSAEENQLKGEKIYENYVLLKKLIGEIIEARKKHSWAEIKNRLRNHDIIKEVNEKENKISFEIE